MGLMHNKALWVSLMSGSSAVAIVSGAAGLLDGEASGFAIDFTDDHYVGGTGFYGSAKIIDAKTTGQLVTESTDFLTYTSPSIKMVEQEDGSLAYGAMNLCASSEGIGASPWTGINTPTLTSVALGVQVGDDNAAASEGVQITFTAVSGATYSLRILIAKEADTATFPEVGITFSTTNEIRTQVNKSTGAKVDRTAVNGTSTVTDYSADYWLLEQIIVADGTTGAYQVYGARGTTLGVSSTAAIGSAVFNRVHVRRTPSVDTYLKTTTAARISLPTTYSSGVAQGILAEEARTNSVFYSNTFDNAYWNKSLGVSITAAAATSPDGRTNASKLYSSAASAGHYIYNGTAITGTAVAWTGSVYCKAAEYDEVAIGLYQTTVYNIVQVSLTDGSVVSADSSLTVVVDDVGNGWYRINATQTNAASNTYISIQPYDSSLADYNGTETAFKTYTGDGSSGIYIYQADYGVGAFATSPIETFASSATRAVDNITLAQTRYASSQSTITAYVKYRPVSVAAAARAINIDDATENERISMGHQAAGAGFVQVLDGGVTQLSPLTSGTVSTTAFSKIAASIAANDAAFSKDGGAAVTDTSLTLPTTTQLRFGAGVSAANQMTGVIAEVLVLPRAMSDAELVTLTTDGLTTGNLLGSESAGLALDFTSNAYEVDLSATSEGYSTSPDTTASSLLTYTGPASGGKFVEQPDGTIKRAAHNLCLQSNTLATAGWSASNATVTNAAGTAPGSYGAVASVYETAASGLHQATYSSVFTPATGGTYTVAIVAKASGRDYVEVVMSGVFTTDNIVRFTLTGSGTATARQGSPASSNRSCTLLSDGYYLCKYDFTPNLGTTATIIVRVAQDASGTPSYAGTAGIGVLAGAVHIYRAPADSTFLSTTSAARFALPLTHSGGSPAGLQVEEARTNLCLYSNDLTQSNWTKTSATAAKTATGPGGLANNASTLTATANNANAIQRISSASAARSGSVYLKRRTGTGDVTVAIGDGGANLLTDGSFTSGVADWTNVGGGSITHTGTAGQITGAAATNTGAYAVFSTTAGKLYRTQVTVTLGTATIVDTLICNTALSSAALGSSYTAVTASGTTVVGYAYATTTTLALAVYPRGAGLTCTIDDASCIEVTEATVDLSSGEWVRGTIENKTITNPCMAIKLATSGDEVDVALADVETGAYCTSPIETFASSATRAVDVVRLATTAFPYSAVACTVFADVQTYPVYTDGTYWTIYEAGVDYFRLYNSSSGRLQVQLRDTTLGLTVNVSNFGNYYDEAVKFAAAVDTTSYLSSKDGALYTAEVVTTHALPASGTLRFGHYTDAGDSKKLLIRRLAVFPRKFTQAELNTLTTP